jgi:hypothetical protein
LEKWGSQPKPRCIEYAEQRPAKREKEQGRKDSSQQNRNRLGIELSKEVALAHRRQDDRSKEVGANEKDGQKPGGECAKLWGGLVSWDEMDNQAGGRGGSR